MYNFLIWITPFLLFFFFSLFLFIHDGTEARKEGRKRKTAITVMFIISGGLLASVIALAVLLVLLTIAIVQNM